MRITYAARRGSYYPSQGWGAKGIPPKDVRQEWLAEVRAIGFEGLEITASAANEPGGGEAEIAELRREIEDAGLPCVAVRTASRVTGAGFVNPRHVARHRELHLDAIRYARLIGAPLYATTLGTQVDPRLPGDGHGEPTSQHGSREARADDFERNARVMRELADIAADAGLEIAIELAQHSVFDNSWSVLHQLDLIDRPNVGVNADLGNLYWTYDVPEETAEAAMLALARRLKYWHCKNLLRVHVPGLNRAIFLQTALPDGDLDYRFLITAAARAGYQGCIAIEGGGGDELTRAARSVSYVKAILEG
ncbi:MAG: sugar phosphate isomerase/epimerase [Chloroflexi bacterium]|nr:sugar phosphate isomerase/epimerase [Chloroflexota bacterium]